MPSAKSPPELSTDDPVSTPGRFVMTISACRKPLDSVGNFGNRFLVASTKDRHEFTKDSTWNRNKFGILQDLGGLASLLRVVLNGSPNKDIPIGCYFHFFFAHPWRAISFILSIVSLGPHWFERQPTKPEIAPSCAAAFTIIRPSGSLSASIFSSGATPRCQQALLQCDLSLGGEITVVMNTSTFHCKAVLPYYLEARFTTPKPTR